MASRPLLSIIITSYTLDRLRDIFELLDSIKTQTYDHIEIILVVERSTELLERIKRYIDENAISNTKVVFNLGEPSQSSARNFGISEAKGDLIAFIDDDALPFVDWAEEMVKTYNDDSVVGVTGPAVPLWEDRAMSWFPEEFYWIIGGTACLESNEMRRVRNVWGMNMSFRTEALGPCRFALGHKAADDGTKVGIEGEETELSIRVQQRTGKLIVFNPKVRVHHKVFKFRVTPKFIRRKAFWQGYTKAVLKNIYRHNENNINVLETEYRLLRQILLQLLPSIGKRFFSHPINAWKSLCFTITVLFYVALGYFSAAFPRIGTLTRKAYGWQP